MRKTYLIVVMGLPGSGKTFFARKLAVVLSAVHISSDRVRKQAESISKYTLPEKITIYKEMLVEASNLLDQDQSVLLDATFHKEVFREMVFDFAQARRQVIHLIEIVADEVTIEERVGRHRKDSEADYAVYQQLRTEAEPITRSHLKLDSSQLSIEEMLRVAKEYLKL